MTEVETRYNERKDMFKALVGAARPERVPIFANMAMWPVGHSGHTIQECFEQPEIVPEAFVSTFRDLHVDFYVGGGIGVPVEVVNILGGTHYFVSEDGVTVQHKECCPMLSDEYDLYMKDPRDYIINNFSRRKYSKLNGPKDEAYDALKKAIVAFKKHKETEAAVTKACAEKGGVVAISGPSMGKLPLDNMFNKLRGFKGTITDMRRQPEKVIALLDYISEHNRNRGIVDAVKKNGALPVVPYAHHSVPFIGAKFYEKFWWPYFDVMARPVAEAGGKLFLRSENDSTYAFNYYKDYPKHSFLYILENEDPYEVRKIMGDSHTYMGGMKLAFLKLESKEKCIDYAKKAIEDFGGNGQYIFTTDKGLIGRNDANAETFMAVTQFVSDYRW